MKIPALVTEGFVKITDPEEVAYCNRINQLIYSLSQKGGFADRDMYEYRSPDILCRYFDSAYDNQQFQVFIRAGHCDSILDSLHSPYDGEYDLMYECIEDGKLHLAYHIPFEKLEELLKNG